MLYDVHNSKEAIKNRMIKHALTYWGIKNTEDIDPAIKLILEALSLELYNFSNEIKDTQVRILEKISNLLAPDFLTSPNPAHAVLHARPVEPTESLSAVTSFVTQLKISSKQNEIQDTAIEVYFTPVGEVQLFDAQIACIVTGGNLHAYDPLLNKQLVARAKNKNNEINTVWLGLRTNPGIVHIKRLAFYFEWQNLEPKLAHRTYQLLPMAKWFTGDTELDTVQGIQYGVNTNSGDTYENIFMEYDLLSLMEKDIKNFYDYKFISISDERIITGNEFKQAYPVSFKTLFADNDLQKLNEKLLWVKVIFPAAMQQELLNDVNIYTNAFPVVNRQVNDLKYRLKGKSNIIPLKTGLLDQFLSVKSLSDEVHTYKSVPYRKMEQEESGTYTLRNGGVERFDERNAREMISYLLELLRSESAAFAAFGYDFIASTLKEMNQKIALMEQKTKGYTNNATEIPNYIIVKPFDGQDIMYAEYWTTLAEAANNLRTGTRMQLAKGVKVNQESIQLMTTTTGGKNKLRPEERLNAFRYGIMTRNRIITKEDIRNFCFYELEDRINKVEVERGFEMSVHAKEAFRRTIDVILTVDEDENPEGMDWQVISEQLKSKLQARSGPGNYYRIVVRSSEFGV